MSGSPASRALAPGCALSCPLGIRGSRHLGDVGAGSPVLKKTPRSAHRGHTAPAPVTLSRGRGWSGSDRLRLPALGDAADWARLDPQPLGTWPRCFPQQPSGVPVVEEGAAWEAVLLELHIWPVVGSACSGLPAAESEPCSLPCSAESSLRL